MFQTFILAILQSVTEFLPVSSSGHLILLPRVLRWEDQGIIMDIGFHVGTLLAVCVYFYKDIFNLLKSLFCKKTPKKLLLNLIIATIPIPIFALCFLPVIRLTRQPVFIAVMLIIFGIILFCADKFSKSDLKKEISAKDALFIGLAQCLSVFPGVSRSGITITAARLCQIDRVKATHFSMLLSVPTITLAALWALLRCKDISCTYNPLLIYGILYAFIFGLTVIWILMRFVKKHSFFVFMTYRIILGLMILRYFLL